MDLRRLATGDFVAAAGGLLLAASLFLAWYSTGSRGEIDGASGELTGWSVHGFLRYLLLAAAAAPLILVWIIIRDHELSWAKGEMTAVVGIAAFGFVVYNGVIDRPGEPAGEISLALGWVAALLGTMLMIGGAAHRAATAERARKPPGVL